MNGGRIGFRLVDSSWSIVALNVALLVTMTTLAVGCIELSSKCDADQECLPATGGGGMGGAAMGAALGKLGEPCSEVGTLACADHASKSQLICGPDGKWSTNGTCDGETRCDTTLGSDQGTCKTLVPGCVSAGDMVCIGSDRMKCGIDLITSLFQETCAYVCQAGACVGTCVPNSIGCQGNTPQTCDMNGQWQPGSTCSSDAPVCIDGECKVPSCNGLATTCGPSGSENCCASTLVPGGTYNRSNDPASPATVSDFRLDRFEVTVGRFRKFVEAYPASKPAAGAGKHPMIAGSGWDAAWNNALLDKPAMIAAFACVSNYAAWTDVAGANENLPMNCVSWYEAFAFCAWDGGRLPTEAEWNLAAAGGSEQRAYPWSKPPSATMIDGTYAVFDCMGNGSPAAQCSWEDIQLVGSRSPKGDGKWGHADLAGSMWEWSLDRHSDSYPTPCIDCANLAGATGRVFRGGSWPNAVADLSPSARPSMAPSERDASIGLRCARTP